MTVSDPTSVDTIAKAPDGRLLLVMTEDRFSAGGDAAAMAEQLREKVNGHAADGAGGWSPQDWAEELHRFPRTDVPAWWRARLS